MTGSNFHRPEGTPHTKKHRGLPAPHPGASSPLPHLQRTLNTGGETKGKGGAPLSRPREACVQALIERWEQSAPWLPLSQDREGRGIKWLPGTEIEPTT
eukprot:c30553_g1_i1 orf=25-321(-)